MIAEPLEEIVRHEKGLDNIVGGALDLGARLAAMSRLAAAEVVDQLVKVEPSVAKVMPELSERAKRLAKWLMREDFSGVRAAIGQRILRDLGGGRRLRPSDPEGEIDVTRGLAMSLTAAAGKLLPLDDVQAAFTARSKMLTTGDFVEAYLGEDAEVMEEAQALVWLIENIIGGGQQARGGPLALLADLQPAVRARGGPRTLHGQAPGGTGQAATRRRPLRPGGRGLQAHPGQAR